jgi:adenylate kinase
MKYRTILLFGAPGAGKGTQGKILGSIPNYYHCACGDVFRNLTADSEIGRVFVEYSSRGELVPDQPTVDLWRQFIDNCQRAGRFKPDTDTLVLDGIPRNAHQAEMLKDMLDVRAVFYLRCPSMNKLVQRLQSRALRENRLDDANLDIIKHRLKTYERETKPVLNFYGNRVVHKIDSTQSPAEVLADILRHINKI